MRAESAWASEIRAGVRVDSIWRARSAAQGQGASEAGRQASGQAGMRRKQRDTYERQLGVFVGVLWRQS